MLEGWLHIEIKYPQSVLCSVIVIVVRFNNWVIFMN